MSDTHYSSISTSYSYFLNFGQRPDFVIYCQGQEFHVHRSVVCSQSRFFDVAANGAFLEASRSKIYLDDDDPDSIERMLTYFYTNDYDDRDNGRDTGTLTRSPTNSQEDLVDSPALPSYHTQGERSQALNNALVYAVADKYSLPGLKQLAASKFSPSIHSEDFVVTLQEVYQSTPNNDRGLRNKIMVVCAANLLALKQDEAYVSTTKQIARFDRELVGGIILKDAQDRGVPWATASGYREAPEYHNAIRWFQKDLQNRRCW